MPSCSTKHLSSGAASPGRRRLLAALGAGACALAQPAAALGLATLPGLPRRPAVFDLAALDILQALGVEVAGVPKAAYPQYLSRHAAGRPIVGTLFDPDYEALAALRPDLILVAGRSAGKSDALSKLAPTIDLSTSTTGFVASVAQNILLLGRLFGRSAQAAELTERMLADVRALQAQGAKAGRGLVLFVAGGNIAPQVAHTRFGVLYEVTGIAPAIQPGDLPPAAPRSRQPEADGPEAQARRQRQAAQQQERLAALLRTHDPDWLLVLDRSAATGGEAVAAGLLAANPAVVQTTAWRREQVIHLDAPGWYLVGGAPSVLERSTTQIGKAIGGKA